MNGCCLPSTGLMRGPNRDWIRMAQPLVAARPGRTNLSVGARACGRTPRSETSTTCQASDYFFQE